MTLSDKVWESFYEQFEVWVHFLIWAKKKHFFLENCTIIWSEFLYLFIRPGNLNFKFCENLAGLSFQREKVSTFAKSKWYMYTLWLLITLCNMSKGLLTYLQGKQQLFIHAVWVVSWAMWVYNTTQAILLVPCYWYKGCNIISDTLNPFMMEAVII